MIDLAGIPLDCNLAIVQKVLMEEMLQTSFRADERD